MRVDGCNKMTCSKCHTVSCYVCKILIPGYEHFNDSSATDNIKIKGKCALWASEKVIDDYALETATTDVYDRFKTDKVKLDEAYEIMVTLNKKQKAEIDNIFKKAGYDFIPAPKPDPATVVSDPKNPEKKKEQILNPGLKPIIDIPVKDLPKIVHAIPHPIKKAKIEKPDEDPRDPNDPHKKCIIC
jgi:hypothetical protein